MHGRPLVIIHSGRFDPKTRDLQGSVNAVIYLFEAALKELPPGQTQFAVLYDRKDFSFRENWDFELLKTVFTMLSANYPERLGAAYVYPAGPPLSWLWGLVKTFLDPRTRAKVRMLGSSVELLSCIPAQFLPVSCGGNSTHQFDPAQLKP